MVLISDGFEKDSLSNIWSDKKLAPGSWQIQSEIARKGKKSIKITISEGDIAGVGNDKNETERDELLERKDFWSQEDKLYSYKFSTFIPSDFPIVSTRLVIAQWKQRDDSKCARINNPLIAVRYVNANLHITLQTSEKRVTLFSTQDEIRGKWLDFAFNICFSRTNSGFLQVYCNDKQIIEYSGVTAYSEQYDYPPAGRFLFKMGLYRDRMTQPMTIYFDEYSKEEK